MNTPPWAAFRSAPRAAIRPALLLALALATPASSLARTWIIQHDPGIPRDQIGAIVLQATSGDSLLIGPGTYYEHIPTETKTLTFIGTEGAGATVLDGDLPIQGRQGSIIYSSGDAAGSLGLRGLTLQHGHGTTWEGFTTGGAINWTHNSDRPFPDMDISDCTFQDNTPFQFGVGSVLDADVLDHLLIHSCTFRNNCCAGESEGMVASEALEVEVGDCEFDMVTEGTCALFLSGTTVDVEGCTFQANATDIGPSLWLVDVSSVTIAHNQFMDAGPVPAATAIETSYEGIPEGPFPYEAISIHDNLLWDSAYQGTGADPTVQLDYPNQGIDVERNTFVGCGLSGGGIPATIRNNLFYKSKVELSGGAEGQVQCNDAWPTAMQIPGQGYTIENNIAADPEFCGPADGDFQIAATSPCANGNSPAGCRQIGELGVGCGDTRVETSTWGQVKNRFRR